MKTIESVRGQVDAIAIGASAGGIDALSVLLPALPPSMRVPVFVVLHLPRERPSLLVDIFQPKCAAAVCEAQDKDPVQPGIVYFAPPDYHLLVDQGPQVVLSADGLVNFSRPSVDVLFESAADVYGGRLLGMVLTGASQDGALGLRAIHEAGGWTAVQQPDGAHSPLMAEAALRRTAVDFVLPLDEMARLLRIAGEEPTV